MCTAILRCLGRAPGESPVPIVTLVPIERMAISISLDFELKRHEETSQKTRETDVHHFAPLFLSICGFFVSHHHPGGMQSAKSPWPRGSFSMASSFR